MLPVDTSTTQVHSFHLFNAVKLHNKLLQAMKKKCILSSDLFSTYYVFTDLWRNVYMYVYMSLFILSLFSLLIKPTRSSLLISSVLQKVHSLCVTDYGYNSLCSYEYLFVSDVMMALSAINNYTPGIKIILLKDKLLY